MNETTAAPGIRFEQPRRRDRAIEDEGWIHDLLDRTAVGTLATEGERSPSLNPNLFVFDPQARAIYLHTAKTGRTRENLEKRPRASFCVAEMGRLLPGERAVHFSVEFASVTLEGPAAVVHDEDEARRALELFMAKYAPHLELGKDYGGILDRDLDRTSVLKVEIESWTGKGKTSEAEDAYTFASVRGESATTGCPRSS